MKLLKRNYANSDILQAVLNEVIVTKDIALEVPYIAGSVNLLANLVASLTIKLYQDDNGEISEVKTDSRVALLNDDTNDLLSGYAFKRNMIMDYLLFGQAFAYIHKTKNQVQSIHYIDNSYINVIPSVDPIFKDAKINVLGKEYRHFEFIKLLKNTPDGVRGTGIVQENKELISLAYKLLKYQRTNVETGGIKKGVIKSTKKLSDTSLTALKESWRRLYGKDSTENCIILNDGLEYQDLANTPVEMQIHEVFTSVKDQVGAILSVPETVLKGTATEFTQINFIKHTLIPILNVFETALNQTLLLEREKGAFYFAFDTKELLKGDIEKRYKAYEIGIKNGFIFPDEVRYMEDYSPMGLDFIKLQLSDVLYNPRTKEIYTPNTNAKTNLSDGGTLKGGDENEDRDTGK